MRHLSSENATTPPPLASSKRAWQIVVATLSLLLVALTFTCAVGMAHAAPPDTQKQQPTYQWAGVSYSDLAPAAVAPNTGGNCLGVTLTVQTVAPGGAVQVNLAFKNNCLESIRNVTWQLTSSVQCSAVYSGNVTASGGFGTSVFVGGAGASLLTNHMYSSSCELVQNRLLNYTMSVTGTVHALLVSNTTISTHGQVTVTGTYH